MRWSYHPNGGRLAAVDVNATDGPRLVARGWLTVNGRKALVEEQYPGVNIDGSVTLRVCFEEPYPLYAGNGGGRHK